MTPPSHQLHNQTQSFPQRGTAARSRGAVVKAARPLARPVTSHASATARCWLVQCGSGVCSEKQVASSGRSSQSGLTILEILVVVSISTLVIAALVRFLSTGFPISKITYLQQRSTETARLQLDRIAEGLREARDSDSGAYPLVEAEPQRIVFYSDVDGDDATERIRYELVGTELHRGVVKPTGDPLTYNEADEEVSVVTKSIRNGSDAIFTYYTGDYPDDPTPLTPTDLTEITYIQFRLVVDVEPNQDPPATEVISQVQLRNLKTNLGETTEEG